MIYYTSDLRLGANNIIKHENRPYKTVDEMDKALIDNWNSRVTNDDEVYVLGDFCFKGATRAIEYLEQLNGHIHLIRGNHDYFMSQLSFVSFLYQNDNKVIWDNGTPKVTTNGHYAYIKDGEHEVILCHYPILYWENMEHGSIHLYGHVQSYRDRSQMASNSYNVGVDVNNYRPVTLEELLEKEKK